MIRLKLSGFTARDTQVSATVTCVLSIWFIVHNSSGGAKCCASRGRTPPLSLMGNGMVYTLANSRHTTPHILRNRNKTCMASERNTDKAIWLFRCKKTAATAVSFRSGGVMGVAWRHASMPFCAHLTAFFFPSTMYTPFGKDDMSSADVESRLPSMVYTPFALQSVPVATGDVMPSVVTLFMRK